MTTNPAEDDPAEERPLQRDDAVTPESNQCEAIAEYTSKRCQRLSLPSLPYCPLHVSDLEPVDSSETDRERSNGAVEESPEKPGGAKESPTKS